MQAALNYWSPPPLFLDRGIHVEIYGRFPGAPAALEIMHRVQRTQNTSKTMFPPIFFQDLAVQSAMQALLYMMLLFGVYV